MKILLKGAWYSCLLKDLARALQIQSQRLTDNHCIEYGEPPNGGVRQRTEGAERVRNTIERTTSTNQTPPRGLRDWSTNQGVHMALSAYVAEDSLVRHQWEERSLVLWKFYRFSSVWELMVGRWEWIVGWRNILVGAGWGGQDSECSFLERGNWVEG